MNAHKFSIFLFIVPGLMLAIPVAHAQSYPSKQIRFVVGFPAGGATDVVARAISQNLAEALGHPVVVDNRAGAASNIAAEIVATAPKDGHTIFLGTVSLAINPSLQETALQRVERLCGGDAGHRYS